MTSARCLALLAVLSVAACKSKDKLDLGSLAGGGTLKASDASWKDTELTIGKAKAKFFMTGTGDKDPSFMSAYFDDFPAGTKVDVAGTKGTTNDRGYLALDVDMRSKLGALSLRSASNAKVDLGVDIVVEAPGSEVIRQKLPAMQVAGAIASTLAKARDGALKFEGEPPDDRKVTSIVLVQPSSITLKIVGAAEKVWDVDWVAVNEQRESGRTKSCSGYRKVQGNVEVAQIDSVVKIVDRRTGKIVQEKTFQPKEECPSFAMVSADNKAKAFVLDTQIEPWLRETLDKQR